MSRARTASDSWLGGTNIFSCQPGGDCAIFYHALVSPAAVNFAVDRFLKIYVHVLNAAKTCLALADDATRFIPARASIRLSATGSRNTTD